MSSARLYRLGSVSVVLGCALLVIGDLSWLGWLGLSLMPNPGQLVAADPKSRPVRA